MGGTKSKVTDNAVLETIAHFIELTERSLINCQVGDSGLLERTKLPHLRRFIINQTKVTRPGLMAFHKQKPGCQIVLELGLLIADPERD